MRVELPYLEPITRFNVKDNHIDSVVSEILRYKHTDILLLFSNNAKYNAYNKMNRLLVCKVSLGA